MEDFFVSWNQITLTSNTNHLLSSVGVYEYSNNVCKITVLNKSLEELNFYFFSAVVELIQQGKVVHFQILKRIYIFQLGRYSLKLLKRTKLSPTTTTVSFYGFKNNAGFTVSARFVSCFSGSESHTPRYQKNENMFK